MAFVTESRETILIGITGGIGSGKSTVGRFWSSHYNLPLFDLDAMCRLLLEPGEPGWAALRDLLDGAFFTASGELDRPRLRSAIFLDEALRSRVNELIHPLALQLMQRAVAGLSAPLVLADVPLLYEAGWQDGFQRIVVIFANRKTCCRRIVFRDGVSGEEALRALRSQMSLAEKALRADHVVDNSGCWLRTRLQAVHLAGLYQRFISGSLY
ncbi:MAG: dephospho-CoA kinase [Proteobacteria bacterium]|nr:dephospho-CoA kinase [Pseudomonadota bacterium]